MEAYNRESTAYDFSLFDTSVRKSQPVEEPKKAPEVEVVSLSAAKRGNPALIIAVSLVFAAIVMMFMYSKATLSEVSLNVGLKTDELAKVQMINDELSAQLGNSVTLESVEDFAENELGMQKALSSQEQYVEMNTGAMTENTADDSGDIFVGIQNWVNDILEYLGL